MPESFNSKVLTCTEIPTDTIQVHADHAGSGGSGRIWLETNTNFAAPRTTICMKRADVLKLIAELTQALITIL